MTKAKALKKSKIVYVAGYGRSGSTLLDSALGNHADILGAGELTWLFQYAADAASCTCGAPLMTCEIWREVLRRVVPSLEHDELQRVARESAAAERFMTDRRSHVRHREIWETAFAAIRELTGRSTIVDSSKSTRSTYHRLHLLNGLQQSEVYVLHLVRNPRGVMHSARRGSNRRLEAGQPATMVAASARALTSWLIANRNVQRYCLRHMAGRYVCVRYEELVQHPQRVMANIGAVIDCDLSAIADALVGQIPLETGHGVSGNRLRRSGPIQLRVDTEWQHQPHRMDRLLAALARPWTKSYGY
ncbi:MAG: sulfotransferase [Planctomycetales bacterium]|nr:sulfotransferase [Planctomycetales bacterium]